MHTVDALNAQLDRLQGELIAATTGGSPSPSPEPLDSAEDRPGDVPLDGEDARQMALEAVVRSFDRPPRLHKLSAILKRHAFTGSAPSSVSFASAGRRSKAAEEDNRLEWLVLARSSVVITHALLDDIFDRYVPLADDLAYWESIVRSRLWSSVYLVQSAPARVWSSFWLMWGQVDGGSGGFDLTMGTLRRSIHDRTLLRQLAFPHLAKRVSKGARAPLNLLSLRNIVKQEVNLKITALIQIRQTAAQLVGILATAAQYTSLDTLHTDTQALVSTLTHAVDQLTQHPNDAVLQIHATQSDDYTTPEAVCRALVKLADEDVPRWRQAVGEAVRPHGRPGRLVRWWPVVFGLWVGVGSLVSFVSARRDALVEWIREGVETTKAFWQNWIVQPLQQIIATIRHDQSAQLALISSKSLASDVDSLERMVVDFARDNPSTLNGTALEQVGAAVREGDVTPVLAAYERDLKSPLRSAVTGTLVRALLIQVQKTKVDVEVAIAGIDKLLKSQELVFASLGISPAIVILVFALRAPFRFITGSRRATLSAKSARLNAVKLLRNIDRLLAETPLPDRTEFRQRGMVLCEAQVLRKLVDEYAPKQLRGEFVGDLDDLEAAIARRSTSTDVFRDDSSSSVSEKERESSGWKLEQRRIVGRIWQVHSRTGGLLQP
ncbi:Nuclear control of ATPase protein 2 [Savitreella phatthalungensis]